MAWELHLEFFSLIHFLPITVQNGSSQDSACAIRQQLWANQSRAKHSFIQHLLNQAAQLRKPSHLQWQPGKRQLGHSGGSGQTQRLSGCLCNKLKVYPISQQGYKPPNCPREVVRWQSGRQNRVFYQGKVLIDRVSSEQRSAVKTSLHCDFCGVVVACQ